MHKVFSISNEFTKVTFQRHIYENNTTTILKVTFQKHIYENTNSKVPKTLKITLMKTIRKLKMYARNLKEKNTKLEKLFQKAANKAEIITTSLDQSICAKYGRHAHRQISHADGSFLHVKIQQTNLLWKRKPNRKKKINQLNLAEELNRIDIEELKRKGRRRHTNKAKRQLKNARRKKFAEVL